LPDYLTGVEYRVLDGAPAVEILEAARQVQCDLIVLGTHGHTGLERLVMGSVAEEVMRKAKCPVLTVKVPLINDLVSGAALQKQVSGSLSASGGR
jgi:nucleotide-binding universal stress UspA family protein